MLKLETYRTLSVRCDQAILHVSIERPEALNALNSEVLRELKALLSSLVRKKAIRGMVLSGSGDKAFIAGADIKEMSEMTPPKAKAFCKLGQDTTILLEELPFPVIACVNGHALGGGCEMAISCDMIYATTSARFGLPETKLGLIPGFGGTQRLSRLISPSLAREMIYTGRTLRAEEALEAGLVLRILPTKEELLSAALQTLTLVKKASFTAVRLAKKVMRPSPKALNKERQHFVHAFLSKDGREGLAAFLEKRPPNFGENS